MVCEYLRIAHTVSWNSTTGCGIRMTGKEICVKEAKAKYHVGDDPCDSSSTNFRIQHTWEETLRNSVENSETESLWKEKRRREIRNYSSIMKFQDWFRCRFFSSELSIEKSVGFLLVQHRFGSSSRDCWYSLRCCACIMVKLRLDFIWKMVKLRWKWDRKLLRKHACEPRRP